MRSSAVAVVAGIVLGCLRIAAGQAPAALDQRVGTIDLRERTLARAVDALAGGSGVHIAVVWDALGGEEASDSKLNISFSGCRLRDALRAMFPAAEAYEDAAGVHVVAKNFAPVTVRTYPIGDILGVVGPGVVDDLVRVVEDVVDSDSWADNGGRFPLHAQGGVLIAVQTQAGHEAVGRLLDLMRDAIRVRNDPTGLLAVTSSRGLAKRRITSLHFLNTPLDVALADLLAAAHLPWMIRWDALESLGVSPGTPLTLELSGRTLGEATALIGEVTGVHFSLHDGMVEVSSADAVPRVVEPRVLDARPMGDAVGWGTTLKTDVVASGVADLIERLIETDSWKDNGGPLGVCRAVGDLVVVNNTAQAQEQVSAMMADLQAASQPSSQPAAAEKTEPLSSRVYDLDLTDTTLEQAIDRLGQRTGVQIVVDWRTLESAGVDRNAPVSVKLGGGSLRSGLTVVLELAGKGDAALGCMADEAGIVHIGSAESMSRFGVVKIYNIRDLITRFTDYANAGGRNASERELVARSDAVDSITKLIEDTVETDSWKDNGGSVGALRELGGLLIVSHTPQGHAKIRAFLETLRTQAGSGISVGK